MGRGEGGGGKVGVNMNLLFNIFFGMVELYLAY